MNYHYKRILTAFSVALNIGFIVAAIVIYYNHPSGSHGRYPTNAKKIVDSSELTSEKKQELISALEEFTKEISGMGMKLHQGQIDMLKVLSHPGPLDYNAFQRIYERQNLLWKKKHETLRDHLLFMRKNLGDEKSGWFFSRILANNK